MLMPSLMTFRVIHTDEYPEWNPGAKFKAKREEMLNRSEMRK
jgi:hypothetical protein